MHGGPEGIVDAERLIPAFLVLVGHKQLDARRRSRRMRAGAVVLAQRLEVLAPGLLKAAVDRLEHLAAAAEVDRDALRAPLLDRLGPMAAEHADVGVAKAVDGLALVPDPKQVVALEQCEELVLERIGVLELVHEHVGKALGVLQAQSLVGREQVARDQLQVLEVESGARALALGVAVAVELEEHAQHRVVVVFALPAAEALVGAEGRAVLVADGRAERVGVLPDRQLLEIVGVGQLARRRPLEHGRAALESLDGRGDALSRSGPGQLGERGAHGGLEPFGLARDARRLRLLEARAASAAAAQSRVGGADHVAQAVGRVGRDHLEALGLLALAHEGPEGAVEGVGGDALGLELVEHAEVRVDARAERVSAQHARAEAVDRRDPGRLGGAGVGAPAEIEKAPAHARPHLGRGLLGEGDGEDGVDCHAVLDHRLDEALHEHGGLAGAGPGTHHQRAVPALDGPGLLRGQAGGAHVSHRQIEG